MSPEEITCNANLLWEAAHKVIKSAPKKASTLKFERDRLLEIGRAQEELESRRWKIEPMKSFIIRERGHPRKIQGNTPYDRMILHCYLDNVLEPALKPYLIYDNYASQTDKGVDLARERFRMFLHEAYREYGTNKFYVGLLDFLKYYDNLQHQKVYDEIMRVVPYHPFHEYMLWAVLDSFKVDVSYMTDAEYDNCLDEVYIALDHIYDDPSLLTGEKYMLKGANIGNQAAGTFGVFYPTRVDTYFRVVKGFRRHGRYCDDTFLIHKDKEAIREAFDGAEPLCREMGLNINHKKTQIYRADQPFKFLNRIYQMSGTGHLEERLTYDTICREAKTLKKHAGLLRYGAKAYKSIADQYLSWLGGFWRSMTPSQLDKMNGLYEELFGARLCRKGKHWRYA